MFKLAAAASLALAAAYSPRALQDEVKLPGAPAVNFRTFSGYINVGGSRELFYIFVESQTADYKSDPLTLWTNGGPGCSGLGGFFTEQGPFIPNVAGNLELNEYAWNKFTNMVFIEQPAGVGFSYYGTEKIAYGDEEAATDNYNFILGFLDRFPEYKTNDFYISSESYGGHYIPTLAKKIVVNGGVANFKGLALGNPITYMPYRNYGQLATFAGHEYFPKPLWDQFLANGCDKVMTPNYEGECATLANEMNDLTAGFDPYALDFPVCDIPSKKVGRNERATLIKAITRAAAYASAKEEVSPTLRGANTIESVSMRQLTSDYFPSDYEACSQDYATTYLNRKDVQDALGVVGASLAGKSGWNDCSNYVGENYNQDDVNAPMMEFWEFLTAGGYDLNMMIYSGDDDSVCATAGTQQFIWNMKWNVTSKWQPWTFTATEGSQIGGFHVAFENPRDTTGKGGVLHFCTVHGAGHMTPATRPFETFNLLQNFMKKKEIFA